MKLALTIDGRPDTMEILTPAPSCRFQLGDAPPRDANVEMPGPGVYSILLDGRSYDVFVEDTPAGLVVKYRIARAVGKIGENDGVLLRQALALLM